MFLWWVHVVIIAVVAIFLFVCEWICYPTHPTRAARFLFSHKHIFPYTRVLFHCWASTPLINQLCFYVLEARCTVDQLIFYRQLQNIN